jgi:hypothetical protein
LLPNKGKVAVLSDEGIKAVKLGSEVEQKVTDCLQDWSAASSKAVQEMTERQRQQDASEAADAAKVQFIISLVGNLAWAATVFFPPAAAVAVTKEFFGPGGRSLMRTSESPGASAATKIVSVLGAAVGSGTIAQFAQSNGSLDWTAVQDYLLELKQEISKNLTSVEQQWTDSYLMNEMIKKFGSRKNLKTDHNDDNEFKDWCNSAEGGRELRKTVWEKFVFPADGLDFEAGELGLKKFLIRKLTELKASYDRQYRDYVKQRTYAYWAYFQETGGYTGTHMDFARWNEVKGSSFHFVVSLTGLPAEFLKAQDQRLRDMQFKLASADVHKSIPTPQPDARRQMRPWGS